MYNETARAQLGNAGWRLLHTMGQRYPENRNSLIHPRSLESTD